MVDFMEKPPGRVLPGGEAPSVFSAVTPEANSSVSRLQPYELKRVGRLAGRALAAVYGGRLEIPAVTLRDYFSFNDASLSLNMFSHLNARLARERVVLDAYRQASPERIDHLVIMEVAGFVIPPEYHSAAYQQHLAAGTNFQMQLLLDAIPGQT
jgi:hypothetical protein